MHRDDQDDGSAISRLLEEARRGLDRVEPADLEAVRAAGALVVDIRPVEQRQRDGVLPDAIVVGRDVLEWRLDPSCPYRLPIADDADRRIVLVCNEGYSSSLAAHTLQQLGLANATDLCGGYQAWAREGCVETAMVTRRLVDVGEVELCVESFGDASAPTLLLVSGAAASMDWWDDDLCRRLAAGGRHVVRYDHRDTGESTTGRPGTPTYDGLQLGRDCARLVAALGVGPVHLVGISMGGGIGQWLALRHPELVASLTLVSTTAAGGLDGTPLPAPSPELRDVLDSPPPDPDWTDVDSYVDWVLAGQSAFAGRIFLDEPRLRALAATVHARSTDPAAAGNHWLVVGGDDDAAEDEPLDVHRIATPTLVVHGSDDPLFPLPHARALAAAIPDAALLVVPGMGHQVPPPATWDLVVPALLRHTGGSDGSVARPRAAPDRARTPA